jgi:hypothetical protein
MRPLVQILAGLSISTLLAGGPIALAAPVGKTMKGNKLFRVLQGRDHQQLIAQLRNDMADKIEAVGQFSGKQRDTPVMHIVPTDGAMVQTRIAEVEIDSHRIGGPGGEFEFHGPKKKTKFKLLIPVNAHYGLPYKAFAGTNTYSVWAEDKNGKKIWQKVVKSVAFGKQESAIVRSDLVTEVEIELPFDDGDEFRVSFTPIDTHASKSNYTSGREVVVRRAR